MAAGKASVASVCRSTPGLYATSDQGARAHNVVSAFLPAAAGGLLVIMTAGLLIVGARKAEALPSFARQTGQPCGACHVDFPQLTPFGRRFKLMGYTAMGGDAKNWDQPGWVPPLSAQAIASFTRTQVGQANQQTSGNGVNLPANDNTIFQEASVWWGGKITDQVGMMLQGDYINPITSGFSVAQHQYNWDMLDLRYANAGTIGPIDFIYGASLNNQVGVQDVWNSFPAWSFPFVVSTLAPTPAAKTLIEGAFTQRVLGAGAYAMFNDLFYVEASAYKSLTERTLNSLGIDPMGAPGTLDQLTPYFRLAFEPSWGKNNWWEVGAFAFLPEVNPQPWNFFGSGGHDRYTDIGVDTQYQYKGSNYWVTVRGAYIHEDQSLPASTVLLGSNPTNQLNSFKASASLAYGSDNTWVFTGGYFNIWGTPDMGLYGPGTAANSINNSPNSDGWIAEISYIPFGMSKGLKEYPWFNARIGLQYIYYNKFNGAVSNFDGMGTNAHDNNTLFFYTQLTW
jgi:hypothetical protein